MSKNFSIVESAACNISLPNNLLDRDDKFIKTSTEQDCSNYDLARVKLFILLLLLSLLYDTLSINSNVL